ncbi:response regulator transcription factor [Segatella albensis]|jgi:DNA-binding response OmpR family regulator|uniref:response regulator transcription factor n=1 Tax=Segatella albensis TaxID=77768 RepID=UPI0004267557|nr:response regulator transcription factor [Segatella albensis]
MDNNIKVLLVEDEQMLSSIIKDTLEPLGFKIVVAGNGLSGLKLYDTFKPNIIVSDIMMPQMDGFEMIRKLRTFDKITPVLFLTAKSGVNDVVNGFELGANDYLRKPFGIQELIVRIKALVSRTYYDHKKLVDNDVIDDNWINIGKYTFNPSTQQLVLNGKIKTLSYRESQILYFLSKKQFTVIKTNTLLMELWGDDSYYNLRSLHVFITKLRHMLSDDKNVEIVNVRGIGYKLVTISQSD